MSDNAFQFDACAGWAGPGWINRPLTWCRERRRTLLILAGAFQIAVLAVMTAVHAAPLILGDTVLLKVEPLDPRDLFRGDYVTLAYGISRVPAGGIEGLADSSARSSRFGSRSQAEECTVYVSLEPDKDGVYWHGTKVSVHRPASGKFLRGVYRRYYGLDRVYYGIETFYVPEGTGRKYEDAARSRQLAAEVAVAPWGDGKLRRLQIR